MKKALILCGLGVVIITSVLAIAVSSYNSARQAVSANLVRLAERSCKKDEDSDLKEVYPEWRLMPPFYSKQKFLYRCENGAKYSFFIGLQ